VRKRNTKKKAGRRQSPGMEGLAAKRRNRSVKGWTLPARKKEIRWVPRDQKGKRALEQANFEQSGEEVAMRSRRLQIWRGGKCRDRGEKSMG